ncbi:MAG: ABC transporter ATP-binding protein/permease [Christensenellaceae bacterium]|nr:ABC transporter ATP-binding protein/permease [Christensenellaceae bacterium]
MDKKQKRNFWLAFLYSIMAMIVTIIPVQITAIVLNNLLGEPNTIFGFPVTVNLSIAKLILVGICLTVGVRLVFNFFTNRKTWIIAQGIAYNVREVAFSWALTPRKNLDLKIPTGDVIHRVNTATDKTKVLVENFLCLFAPCFMTGVFALVIAFFVNVYCGLILLAAVILSLLLVTWRKMAETKLVHLHELQLSKNSDYIVNTLQNLILVHLFTNRNKEKLAFGDKNDKAMHIFKKHSWVWSTYWFFAEIVKVVTVLGILSVAAFSNDVIAIGSIYLLLNFTGLVFEPIQMLGWQVGEAIHNGIALNRVKELKPNENDMLKEIVFDEPIDKIELKNIVVKHESSTEIKNINLTLEKNKVVVLKGISGTGKTTTLRVLCGITEKQSGEIILNDKTHVENTFGLLDRISVVMQGELILNRSVYENVFYAENLKDEQYQKDIIDKLKITDIIGREYTETQGIETSNQLSGGEKKRVAVARSLIKTADAYIFDEPTNELDNANAKIVIELIKSLKKNAMVFVISHDERIYNSADILIEK